MQHLARNGNPVAGFFSYAGQRTDHASRFADHCFAFHVGTG
jgi:hypothetical protein